MIIKPANRTNRVSEKYFSKKSHYRQDKLPVFVMVSKKGIFPSLIFDN